MKMEREVTALGSGGHPDENQLLLALERELSPEEAAEIEHHLGDCWSCRARSHEMQRGILAFVEYREKRYLPSLESPPQNFRGFPGQLKVLAKERRTVGVFARIWRNIWRFAVSSGQLKWVAATASIMAIVIFWTQVVFNPATVSATELLKKAAAAQNPIGLREKSQGGQTAHQKLRISSGRESVVRDFEWTVGSPIPHAHWGIQEEPSKWTAPLTAEGFAEWRDSTLDKKEKVKGTADRWTLTTTADAGTILEAWIVVRASDFHPLEQHIRFADNRQLNFEEMSFEIRAPQPRIGESFVPPGIKKNEPSKFAELASEPSDLNETELQLRYAMFTHKWDLDEDLLITRTADAVVLSGIASSADRAASIRIALGELRNVKVSIGEPGAGAQVPPSRSTQAPKSTQAATVPLLNDTLDRTFTTPEERRMFVDRCLAASDRELSHAWALKKLVDRYTDSEQSLLADESQGKLRQMVATHIHQLGDANAELTPLVELLPNVQLSRLSIPEDWRDRVRVLFSEVERQDSLVAVLIAGAQPNGRDATSVSESLQASHEAIRDLLRGLGTVRGGPPAIPK